MPQTRIDTRRGWLGDRRATLLDAVQRALVAAFRIPPDDRAIVLAEHEAGHFLTPPGCGAGFTVIETVLISGRSIEAKRRYYAALVAEMAALGVPAADVRIILVESPAQNWGVAGRPASEIDLGFDLDV